MRRAAEKSEFYALGAGHADGLYVRAILNDVGMRAKINLRCDAKSAKSIGAETRFVQENKARECEVPVRTRHHKKQEKSKCRE